MSHQATIQMDVRYSPYYVHSRNFSDFKYYLALVVAVRISSDKKHHYFILFCASILGIYVCACVLYTQLLLPLDDDNDLSNLAFTNAASLQ